MISRIKPSSSFGYDEARRALGAAIAGYSTMLAQYSRPDRCDKFLCKRLYVYMHKSGKFPRGQIVMFTVKAQRFRIYALLIGTKPTVEDGSMMGMARREEFRFFDTAEEALHAKALRSLPNTSTDIISIGHLSHIERKDFKLYGKTYTQVIIDDYE